MSLHSTADNQNRGNGPHNEYPWHGISPFAQAQNLPNHQPRAMAILREAHTRRVGSPLPHLMNLPAKIASGSCTASHEIMMVQVSVMFSKTQPLARGCRGTNRSRRCESGTILVGTSVNSPCVSMCVRCDPSAPGRGCRTPFRADESRDGSQQKANGEEDGGKDEEASFEHSQFRSAVHCLPV